MAHAETVETLPASPVPTGTSLLQHSITHDPLTGTPVLVRTGGSGGPAVTILRTPEQLLAHFGATTVRMFKAQMRAKPTAHPVEVLESVVLAAQMALEGEWEE